MNKYFIKISKKVIAPFSPSPTRLPPPCHPYPSSPLPLRPPPPCPPHPLLTHTFQTQNKTKIIALHTRLTYRPAFPAPQPNTLHRRTTFRIAPIHSTHFLLARSLPSSKPILSTSLPSPSTHPRLRYSASAFLSPHHYLSPALRHPFFDSNPSLIKLLVPVSWSSHTILS